MSKIIDDDAVKFFLMNQLDDVTDFGYLLVPTDERLNLEALSSLKSKFRIFMIEHGYEI